MTEPEAPETPFENEVDESSTESWDFEQGDEIMPGRYAMKKLGGGTDYEAYLAWDEHLASLVVAKVLRPHLVGSDSAKKSLAREAAALARLHHPLLVRGFGAELGGERPHLLMEHLEGPHLARLIRKYGPLPLEQLVPLAINLFSAAHYMAAEKMVHLDIKPRNIVVGLPPRLIDLSLARSLSRAERIAGTVGTDLYMAPEQCEPNKHFKIGPPADVWGVGATLYHAISATRPFERVDDHNKEITLERFPQLSKDPDPLDTKRFPALVTEVIHQCLRRDPAERPTAREAMDLLEPALAALPRRQRLGRLRPRFRS